MASVNELLDLINCTIRFSTPEGEYEGYIQRVVPAAETVVIGKLILLPDRLMGALNFRFWELANMKVINRPVRPNENSNDKQDIKPVYRKTATEKLFDLDGSSDIEDEEESVQPEYQMKLVRHLSKWVPRDFAIIEAFNKDFDLAIKHIRKENAIGVSLEGTKISRSSTLSWLCISTPVCIFLFDILALGEQAFRKGLKSILENSRIQKIFHDCRLASDCLYHKYDVRLVNVFDTQAADFIAMMQMVAKDKIDSRVNTLDACLSYYLEVPDDYLYGHANFDDAKDSLNFHALRPLNHEIQDVLIKNVMYLHLLKRELELALLTPLRRATDVYLNCVQKLSEKQLLIVPHKPDELPLDIHLDGIQIFRYQDFEYVCSTAASGPPYREIRNPIKKYLNYRAEYKNGQRKDYDSVVNNHTSQNSHSTPSELNYEATVNYQKAVKSSGSKVVGNSSDSSSESDREHSEHSNQSANYRQAVKGKFKTEDHGNSNNTFVGRNSIVKSEGSHLSESANVKMTIREGLIRLLAYSGRTVDNASQVSRNNSEISAETIIVNNESAVKDSSNTTIELSDLKSPCNPPCRSSMSKASTSQIPLSTTIDKKSPNVLLQPRHGNPPNAAGTSPENSTNDNIVTSKAISKDGAAEINSVIPKAERVQMNTSVAKKDTDISDSKFKELEARVRARGALLRNRKTESSTSDCTSTSDPFSRRNQDKLAKETATFSENQERTSEEVTIYYSETLDKPSQFVVKVNHKSTRLVDLYKKAGDGSLLWNEDGSENRSQSSRGQCNQYADSEDFWAAVRGDMPCQPIDEKLKARLIPAGMSGY